jgi:predicted AAA+ superfamily ATPase
MDNKHYHARVVDQKIEKGLRTFGAILIEGPRWCGKTWTMERHAASVTWLMNRSTRLMAEVEPATALLGDKPHGIDEWQVVPELWDEIRNQVDKESGRGQFLLTGSVSPPTGKTLHSGIGRISRMRMRTLSLYESGISPGSVSLGAMMDSEPIKPGQSTASLSELVSVACKGGWPIHLTAEPEDPFELPYDYLGGLTTPDEGEKKQIRNVPQFRSLLASLARNNATIVKSGTLHNDISKATEDIAGKTLDSYMQHLRDRFLLEEIPGWNPGVSSKARLLSSPKRFFTDPSLAVAAMGAYPNRLLADLPVFGGIFEGMCLRDLLVYVDANDGKVYHYRDNSGLEVDAIVELRGGDWGAFEIKLGGSEVDEGVRAVKRLRDKVRKWGERPPKCLAVLTGTGVALRQDDGVYIVPITLLGP